MHTRDIADDTFLVTWPEWLRWITFLPAAFIGSLLGSIIYRIFQVLMPYITDGWWLDLTQAGIFGAFIVIFGAYTVPRAQVGWGIFFLIVASFFGFASISYGEFLVGIFTIIGAVLGLYAVLEEDKKRS